MPHFVVVGAGVAGHRAATELARRVPGAVIDLLSEEQCLPYDRPPLSKEFLNSSKTAEQIVLAGAADYAQSDIRYRSGTRALAIDRNQRVVVTEGGSRISYDKLLIATGSRPRRLPTSCVGNAHIYYLRTLQDAFNLRQQLVAGRHIAVIGGGFIGLEVAASAIRRGCRVTIIEAQPCILNRGIPAVIGEWVDQLHRKEGVSINLSTTVATMQQDEEGVLITSSGGTLRADLVVAGIGAEPNVELAADAMLEICNGIVVDGQCRTSDPDIYAAGEVTSHPVMHGARRRIESWKSSGEQGAIAARAMAGEIVVFDEIPTLWSDQYETNIQSIGFPDLAMRHEILGDPASNAWTLVSIGEDGSIVGGIAINRGRDASALKRAVRSRADLAFMRPKVA